MDIDIDSVFKAWVKDTARIIKYFENPDVGFVYDELDIPQDSFSLSHHEYYSLFTSDEKKFISGRVGELIETIHEYDELPLAPFNISFRVSTYYNPSTSMSSRFKSYERLEDILITQANKRTEYECVRGKLVHKTTTHIQNGKTLKVEKDLRR